MALLLGIDLGTSYFKVGLFTPAGELRGLGRVPTALAVPAPDRAELAVEAFWDRLRQGLQLALVQAGARVDDIAGLSYSSQANTVVLLDAPGAALTPLIIWTDRRAQPLDEDLAAFGRREDHARITGMTGMVPERAPVKCRWWARHEPETWRRTRWVKTISDYLTWGLTGEHAGDASTAGLTGLYDLEHRAWWPEALSQFGLDATRLAKPLLPGTAVGRTSAAAASRLGLPAGIPFAVGALDHQAAALGSGLGEMAEASLSTGTVLAAMVIVDRVSALPGCIHGVHVDGRRYYRLAFDPRGAGQLEDYQRQQAQELSIEALLRLAEEGSAGHGVAVQRLLTGIAQSQRELLARISPGVKVTRVSATGGGSRSDYWLQLTADTLQRPVVAVGSPERACLGAAMMAAVAAGCWPDLDTAGRRMLPPPREFAPRAGSSS
jgi:xylulokinase